MRPEYFGRDLLASAVIVAVIAAIVGNLSAQKGKSSSAAKPKKGHELIFNVKDSKDQKMYLVIHYNEKLIIKDSISPVAPGKFIFRGEKPYDDGMYSLVSEQKHLLLNFIIDRNQFFEYNLDTTGNVDNFNVINSPENAEMLKFQRAERLLLGFDSPRHYHKNTHPVHPDVFFIMTSILHYLRNLR